LDKPDEASCWGKADRLELLEGSRAECSMASSQVTTGILDLIIIDIANEETIRKYVQDQLTESDKKETK